MLDFEALALALLRKGMPEELPVRPTLDNDGTQSLPLVLYQVIPGGVIGGDTKGKAWNATLVLHALAGDMDDCKLLASDLYDLVHSWNEVWTNNGAHLVSGVGHAADVSDAAMFSRVGTSLVPGHEVTQYTGSFNLVLHQA